MSKILYSPLGPRRVRLVLFGLLLAALGFVTIIAIPVADLDDRLAPADHDSHEGVRVFDGTDETSTGVAEVLRLAVAVWVLLAHPDASVPESAKAIATPNIALLLVRHIGDLS